MHTWLDGHPAGPAPTPGPAPTSGLGPTSGPGPALGAAPALAATPSSGADPLPGPGPGPGFPERTALLRILKLSEEVGEVAEAVIGAYGHNPRKGASHTWDDVRAELCDVIITAMIALRTLTPDAPAVFAAHLTHVHTRSR
ncbi:MazG-like family protein [Streptomyces fradiae]|uniref:MazG-like family protein n=1 Tax=Streptomyces fradiae TaxID=1906 RepID=UPI0035BE6F28